MDEWAELLKLWERAAVTPEQVIGQLLWHGAACGVAAAVGTGGGDAGWSVGVGAGSGQANGAVAAVR